MERLITRSSLSLRSPLQCKVRHTRVILSRALPTFHTIVSHPVLLCASVPSGLPNFVVYLAPRFQRIRKEKPEIGLWAWVKSSIAPGAGTGVGWANSISLSLVKCLLCWQHTVLIDTVCLGRCFEKSTPAVPSKRFIVTCTSDPLEFNLSLRSQRECTRSYGRLLRGLIRTRLDW